MNAKLMIGKFPEQISSRILITVVLIAGMVSILIGLGISILFPRMTSLDQRELLILILPVIAVIVLLVGSVKYDWLVLVTFCLIGFVRVEPAPFDLLLVALLAIGLLTGKLQLPDTRSRPLVWLGLWGLILINLLSLLGNGVTSANLRFLGITMYILVLFFFVRLYAVEPRAMRLLLIGYTVAAVVNAIPVVLGFWGLNFPISVVFWSSRGVGFFKDANVYGPFLVIAAFWLLDRFIHHPNRRFRSYLLLALATILGVGAMLSLSRGAWINMALVGCIYLLFLLRNAPEKGSYLVIFSIVLIIITLAVFQLLGLTSIVIAHLHIQDYDLVRFNLQREGLITAFSSPLGVGPGGWGNAHSLYVRTIAEQGMLGLAALCLIFAGLLFPLARLAIGKRGDTAVISVGLLFAIICGQLVNSFVIDSMHWRHLWVVLGLIWAYLDMTRCAVDVKTGANLQGAPA